MQIKSSFLKRAEFKEFNLNKRIWTIPEHKMKARKEHVIPLSDEAINIIKLMRKKHNHEYVFHNKATGKHISNNGMLVFIKKHFPNKKLLFMDLGQRLKLGQKKQENISLTL